MTATVTREDKLALGMAAAIAVLVIVWGWATGAFAKPPAPGPTPKIPEPTPETPLGPPPVHVDPLAGIAKGDVPPEILAGGVPLEDGWETLAWYSYRGVWLRVDVRPDVDSTEDHPHGLYRWVVVAGDATPLASWSTESLDEFGQIVTFADENTDWIAGKAAEWVDALLDKEG